jgi:RNA polymerase sigma-70 factor (ECF subfamily)
MRDMEPRPPALADLLRHDAFVRAVARGLLRDDAEADEVAQDAWLAALRRPPVVDRGLRGFFATIVRRIATNRGVSAARRAARETRAARRDLGASTADAVQRLETGRVVGAAVLALPAELRDAVLLRWFEGLPPKRAAARLGLSPDAFAGRLKRAHAALRRKLAPEFGDDAGALAAALLPLADAGRGTAGLGLGAATMGTTAKTWTACAIVTSLLVCGWYAFRGDGGAPGPEDAARRTAPAAESSASASRASATDAAATRVVAAAPFAAAEEAPAAPAGPAVVVVRVVDAAGAAVAGQIVELSAQPKARRPNAPPFAFAECAASTDRDGVATFRCAPGTYAATAAARGDPGGAIVAALAGRTVEATLSLADAVRVEGRVVDAAGLPVAGADVVFCGAFSPIVAARSDATGSFVVSSTEAGARFFARSPTHAPGPRAIVSAGPGDANRLTLVVGPAATVVAVRAVGPDDAPVPGAAVVVEPALAAGADERLVLRTDGEGRAEFRGLRAGALVVSGFRAGFAPAQAEVEAAVGERRAATLAFGPGARLVGRVEGFPVGRRGDLGVQVGENWDPTAAFAPLREDGSFALDGVRPGRRPVRFVDGRGDPPTAEFDFVAGAATTWNPRWRAERTLKVRVVGPVGEPLTGVRVQGLNTDRGGAPWCDARTDAAGEALLRPVPAGAVRLVARDAASLAWLAEAAADDATVEATLRVDAARTPSARVVGVVGRAADADPLETRRVSVVESRGAATVCKFDAATGKFESPALPPGTYRVVAAPGARIVAGPRELAAGATWDVGVVAAPSPSVLRVVVATRDPENAAETRRLLDPVRCVVFDDAGAPIAESRVEREAVFVLSPGAYVVAVDPGPKLAPISVAVAVAAGAAATEVVVLGGECAPVAIDFDAGGADAFAAARYRILASGRTLVDGAALLSRGVGLRLAPGAYEVVARAEDGREGSASFVVGTAGSPPSEPVRVALRGP